MSNTVPGTGHSREGRQCPAPGSSIVSASWQCSPPNFLWLWPLFSSSWHPPRMAGEGISWCSFWNVKFFQNVFLNPFMCVLFPGALNMGLACFLGSCWENGNQLQPLFAKGGQGAVIDTGAQDCLNKMLSLNHVPLLPGWSPNPSTSKCDLFWK